MPPAVPQPSPVQTALPKGPFRSYLPAAGLTLLAMPGTPELFLGATKSCLRGSLPAAIGGNEPWKGSDGSGD